VPETSRFVTFLLSLLVSLSILSSCRGPAPIPTNIYTPSPTTDSFTQSPASGVASTPSAEPTSTASPTPIRTVSKPTYDTSELHPPTPTSINEAVLPAAVTNSQIKYSSSEIPTAPDRDLYLIAKQVLNEGVAIPWVVNQYPPSYREGDQHSFWVHDLVATTTYKVTATLVQISDHAYWYVEDGQYVDSMELSEAARIFESAIYPEVTHYFGEPWAPGVDNDFHISILHARFVGAIGYYSSADEYPRDVYPYSNEREIIYINIGAIEIASWEHMAVLAHELQHASHWRGDNTEETWLNEGMSELAATLAGYPTRFVGAFLDSPATSLTLWPADARYTPAHYGAAYLFLEYLAQHHGGYEGMRHLVGEQEDGRDGIDAYLEFMGYNLTFQDVFTDWAVANYINGKSGTFSYDALPRSLGDSASITEPGTYEYALPQYSAHYIRFQPGGSSLRITFQGEESTPLLPVEAHSGNYCWWSNRGDSIGPTLSRTLDLSLLDSAILSFWVWYDIEESWDHVYVQVSNDGGLTWDIIPGLHTSRSSPVGNSFGPGYTGASGEWLEERIDLSDYVGGKIQLRFQYVTDDAINKIGMCIDDIAVDELGLLDDVEDEESGWQASGFFRTNGNVKQNYIVKLITHYQDIEVSNLSLDVDNHGSVVLGGLDAGLRNATLVVVALAQATDRAATYSLEVEIVPK
jgi:immune inhibitor A